MENVQGVLVRGLRYLKGPNIKLIEEDMLGLRPGDKVNRIGGHGRSSSNRKDEFTTFVTYIGLFKEEEDVSMGFKIPSDGVLGTTEDVVILYDIIEADGVYELIRGNQRNGTMLIYKPIFRKV